MRASAFGPIPAVARVLVLSLGIALSACAGSNKPAEEENLVPLNYKSRILDLLHGSLEDPTNIRDAAISEPALKPVGNATRYVVCVRYNPRDNRGQYMGIRTVAAIFYAGDLTQFIDPTNEQCGGAVYRPFPELQKLCRTIGCSGY